MIRIELEDKKFNGLVDRPVNVFDLFISMYTNKMENFRGGETW